VNPSRLLLTRITPLLPTHGCGVLALSVQELNRFRIIAPAAAEAVVASLPFGLRGRDSRRRYATVAFVPKRGSPSSLGSTTAQATIPKRWWRAPSDTHH